ncbi:5580_t:CDS:1 [Dentiscutata erythropus]|uniref:5580_t:CDS:1 n=1 Tax=Dentiscutata erythropus TaxID=1348616 RepID=A0A9N9J7G5_9GLOM|nr:5580_t:CDS:1 [Dentiscutata erythropus]
MSGSSSSTWSLNNDFSAIHNPSSVWSYGYREVVTGKFLLFTHLDQDPRGTGMVAWFPENATWNTNWLGVYYNPNPTTTLLVYNSNMTYTAHGVGMHPDNGVGTPSVIRFTAPNNGNYSLSLTFTHVDDHASNSRTGLYIIYNNLETLWEEELFGIGAAKSYSSSNGGIYIKTNETIDFIVGQGLTGNVVNNINFVTTLITANINLLANDTTTNQLNSANQSSQSSQPSQSSQSNAKVTNFALGTVLGFIISAIIMYFLYRYYKKRKYKQSTYGSANKMNTIENSCHEVVSY